MKLIKVGSSILNQTPLDWENNLANILNSIEDAKKRNVSILCLPELSISGYGCEDAFLSLVTAKYALKQLEKIIACTENISICVGLPLFIEGTLYNAAAFISNKTLLGFSCKQFLAGDGVYYEHRWFKPWPKGKIAEIEVFGKKVQAGEIIYNIGGVKVGIEICEDAWHFDRPARDFVSLNVDIILNPSASHFSFGKVETRKQILLESSRFCGAVYIYANLNGCEAGRIIYDGGAMIASCGKMIAQDVRFSFLPYKVCDSVVDLDLNKVFKAKNININPLTGKNDIYQLYHTFPFKEVLFQENISSVPAWEKSEYIKEEEFTRAQGLGLYDYMRKSRSKGFVLSLSGGLDSSCLVVLVFYLLTRMRLELGEEETLKRFSYFFENDNFLFEDIFCNILTCVYQSSDNSSDTTFNAAKTLSESLGFSFYNFNVSPLIDKYTQIIEQTIDRKLTWQKDDMSLQNIQARVRGPSVWMLANIQNSLLLTTSNRSEAAVGYATMDGDTCGGLCPLGGIDKAFLINWMKWVEKQGPVKLLPLKVVNLINSQKPTAELRPKEYNQTDEQDLMPYDILDKIEKAFFRDKKSPLEIYKTLRNDDTVINDDQQLKRFIIKFLSLWQRNQWKRERYAPSFHLDDESLDPKSSCRYPILSGDFSLEIIELNEITGDD